MTIQQWQSLLERVNGFNPSNISEKGLYNSTEQTRISSSNREYLSIFTSDDLSAFESRIGIILPAQYKKFLQVFGSATFKAGFLDIYHPDSWEIMQEDLQHLKDAIRDEEGFYKDAVELEAGSQ